LISSAIRLCYSLVKGDAFAGPSSSSSFDDSSDGAFPGLYQHRTFECYFLDGEHNFHCGIEQRIRLTRLMALRSVELSPVARSNLCEFCSIWHSHVGGRRDATPPSRSCLTEVRRLEFKTWLDGQRHVCTYTELENEIRLAGRLEPLPRVGQVDELKRFVRSVALGRRGYR